VIIIPVSTSCQPGVGRTIPTCKLLTQSARKLPACLPSCCLTLYLAYALGGQTRIISGANVLLLKSRQPLNQTLGSINPQEFSLLITLTKLPHDSTMMDLCTQSFFFCKEVPPEWHKAHATFMGRHCSAESDAITFEHSEALCYTVQYVASR
jgi:hypothetical protein